MQRWPEKRDGEPEEAGSRGEHVKTQRVAANSGAASALAGKVQSNGAARILAANAR